MMRPALAASIVLVLAACAPTLPIAGPDPASSSSGAASQPYRSPFADFVKFTPVDPRPWRETNDRVRDLDGPDAQMQADSEDDPMPKPRGR